MLSLSTLSQSFQNKADSRYDDPLKWGNDPEIDPVIVDIYRTLDQIDRSADIHRTPESTID